MPTMPKNALFLEKAVKIAAALGATPSNHVELRRLGLCSRPHVYYFFLLSQLLILQFYR